ncbi:MAG: hypothetical protein AAF907_15590, partial [Planctomycetota bacterium]
PAVSYADAYAVPAARDLVARAADLFEDRVAADRWRSEFEDGDVVRPRDVVDAFASAYGRTDADAASLLGLLENDPRRVTPTAIEEASGGRAELTTWLTTFAGASLSDRRHFEEAAAVLADLDPAESPDPATVIFYRAVCAQQLVRLAEADAHLEALLDRTSPLPDGYAALARLMQADRKAARTEEVDEIARLMADAGRRLTLGDERPPTGDRQDEIVEKLDELIDKLEQQAQQQAAAASGSGQSGGATPGSPMPATDSEVKGSTAPGEVDEKTARSTRDWGGLPPRERERAEVDLGNALPADYSRLIEEFTRKRARE